MGQGKQEFGIDKWLAAGEAEQANAVGVGVFQKADGRRDVEAVGPFDRHAAVGTAEVALISPRKRQVIRPKCPRSAGNGAATIAFGVGHVLATAFAGVLSSTMWFVFYKIRKMFRFCANFRGIVLVKLDRLCENPTSLHNNLQC